MQPPKSSSPPRLDPAERQRSIIVLAICFAAAVFEGFDVQAVAIAAPRIAAEWHLGNATIGLIFTLASVGQLIGASICGRLADRFGRKPVFVIAIAFCGVLTFCTPFFSDPYLLGAVRLAAGIALGSAMPAIIAIVAETSVPARRLSNAALIFSGMPLGGVLVALLSGLSALGSSWQSIFHLGGVLTFALLPLIMFFVRETRIASNEHVREKAGIVEALFGESRTKVTLLLWLLLAPTALMLHLLLSWLPILVVKSGYDPQSASRVLLSFSIGVFLGGVLIARLVRYLGVRPVLPTSFCAIIAAAVAVGNARGFNDLFWLAGVLGILTGGVQVANYGLVGIYYPARVRGTGAGLSFAVGRIGTILGPFSAGLMLHQGISPSQILLSLAFVAIVPGVAVLVLSFLPPADGDIDAQTYH